MKSIRDSFFSFIANEDIQKDIKEIVSSMGKGLYNQLYIYIWFICIYNVLLLLLVCVILIILLRIINSGPKYLVVN